MLGNILWGVYLSLLMTSTAMAMAIDAPHNDTVNGIRCGSCHTYSLWWRFSPAGAATTPSRGELATTICLQCHNDPSGPIPYKKPHSGISFGASAQHGDWSTNCTDCHDPHFQAQLDWLGSNGNELYLVTGTIGAAGSFVPNANGTTTFSYTTTTADPLWANPATWLNKTAPGRSLIFVDDTQTAISTYSLVSADANTITVKGGLDSAAAGHSFGLIYGQLIKSAIITPNGGSRAVKFFNPKDTFAIGGFTEPGTPTPQGVCQVCHTVTKYWHSDGTLTGHNNNQSCTACHPAALGFAHGGRASGDGSGGCQECHGKDASDGGHGTTQSHATHTARDANHLKGPDITCEDCHNTNYFPSFKSGTDQNGDGKFSLAETDVCDTCHSPGGTYDGVNDSVFGAKALWATGAYTADGSTLKQGKEKWCAGCHDEEASVIAGVSAPNVVGDENGGKYGYGYNWGYYLTGHKFDCLNCHDGAGKHIDGKHRTYEVINDHQADASVPVPYTEGYRLSNVDGKPALNIPTTGWISYNKDDFALCFKCHLEEYVMGENANSFDRGRTNFFNSTSGQNSHSYHVLRFTSEGDSDWDRAIDANFSCPSCHNVHGAPNQAMVRHGELISTPGTTNAVPAFNMNYILPGDGTGAVRYTPTLPEAGNYEVFAYFASLNGRNEISRAATNAPVTISYNGGSQTEQLTKDLRYNCCSWKSLGTFAFTGAGNEFVEMTSANVDGTIIADGMKWVNTSTGAEVVMDEEVATYLPSKDNWNARTNPGYSVNDDYLDYTPILSPTAPVGLSVAGTGPGSGGLGNNKICGACHYSPVWHRTPMLLPMVIPKIYKDAVLADGSADLLFGAWVKSPGGVVSSVTIDLSVIGGSQTQTLYDDGTHGDVTAGDGLYSFVFRIPAYAPSGTNTFRLIANTDQGDSEADLAVTFVTPGEVVWDNDSGDGLWSTPTNWSTDNLPSSDDRVVFNHTSSTNCYADTIPAGLTYIGLNPGYKATVTLAANLNGGSRTLNVGELRAYSGKLLLQGDTSVINEASGGTEAKPHGAGLTITTANLIVGPNGHISADGQGFGPQAGPGAPSGFNWASGGSYGGFGNSTDAMRDSFPYGSITEPTALGSGGRPATGGSGGGAIKLVVTNTIKVDGLLSAIGTGGKQVGGGSGGGIWIDAGRIEGEGTISTQGGLDWYSGRNGGGGRISLQWDSGNFAFDGVITAEGIAGATNGSLWVNAVGGSNPWAEMWNASRPANSLVAIPPGEYTLNDLRIASGAILECLGDRTAINASSGGTEENPHGAGVTIHSNNIVIEAGGALSADGQGFYPRQGPGTTTSAASNGASYGGYGKGVDSQRRTFAYGSVLAPTALGSGGGSTYAGPGGGAIKLDVSGTVTIDGTLSAVGHGCKMSGAGSGGSLWIMANTIAGSGLINASGGDDYWGTGYSGGGGRIRLEWQTGNYLFNGIVKAEGPDGASNGTLWVNATGGSNAWDELWNGSRHVTGSVALPSGTYTIPELYIDEGVSLDGQGNPDIINEASGGTVGTPHGQGVIINADNITIANNGSLNADGLGFRPQQGPGGSLDRGGSHGGYGNHVDGLQRGVLYGSHTEPTALGSGGGSFATNGMGGGALKLEVTNTITINGTLSANGEAIKGGGGSGGSIWVKADTIAGTGTISAQGPLGWASAYSGGGGRISLKWSTGKLSFNGPIKADGGSSTATNGTLWVEAVGSANPWDELWNASRPVTGSVALPSGSYNIAELTIHDGIRLDVQGDNGASGPAGAGVTINANNLTVETGATIRGDSLGFRQRQGPGAATSGWLGGSHGGLGSSGAGTYGSEILPVSLGSGGNDATYGGTGGSAVKLVVNNTLTINGAISVNGQGTNGGGGAGGSALIIADTISGAGTITANGGANGGGGGRIAVHYNTDNSSLNTNLASNGGGGSSTGGNGTVIFADDADGIHAGIQSAFAADGSGGDKGIQTGDQVIIRFNGSTAGTAITAGNVNTALTLANGHSWLDGSSAIQTALWSTGVYTNDTLTISLSTDGGAPTIQPGDTITLGGIIKDDQGNSPTGTVVLSGTFDTIPTGAVVYWPMDEGSTDKVFDATGSNNDGTLRPSYPTDSPVWNPAGHSASALTFDGSNDYVDAGNPPALDFVWGQPFSLEAWVKFDASGINNDQFIFNKMPYGGNFRGIQLTKTFGKKFFFRLNDDLSANKYISRSSSTILAADTWYHVVASYNGGTSGTGSDLNIYVNGVLDQVAPVDGANAASMTTITSTENFKLGTLPGTSYYFKGTLDEVVVYNRALSAGQAADRFAGTQLLTRPESAFASDASGSGTGVQAGDRVVIEFDSPTQGTAINAGNIDTALPLANGHSWLDGSDGIQSALWSTSVHANDTLTINLSSNGGAPTIEPGDVISLGGIIKDWAGNSVTGTILLGGTFDGVPTGAVAYWTMDEGSGDRVFDVSGRDNTGYLKPNYPSDAPAWTTAGQRRKALSFDGVNDYIDAGQPAALNPAWREPFSVEAWVKFTSVTGFQMLVVKIVNGSTYRGWQLCKNDAHKIAFYLVDDFGAGRYLLRTSSSAVTTGVWYHVVATYDGGATGNGINLYLNEVLDQAAPVDGANASAMTTISNTENVKLGVRGTTSFPFKGTLDEVVIHRPDY